NKQRELLTQWVAEGAKYEEHWSFAPIQRPELPVVKNSQWPRNSIDNFILERLESEGLQPAQQASPETLRRRMSFAITGLPPTAG
ncbi:MAG: DUF1549 domain-containing protein, partial [Verrucomicrobiota bacterium]